ncbi:cytochrome b [Halopseudomonas pelagia]|uniref:cytochrome b n=1 Tax=Halopseudomonas pelagia TaxID=553151 RepID=UPI00039CB1AF|nr:cytochrome b [Halopseudomonas pelagia]|tara:strand:+ start:201382 stop:201927 length:546 start_codon:yes stop_codon:yes gene_type:complete
MSSVVKDSQQRYGLVSRALHWGMAALLAWQFFTTVVRVLLEDSALDEFAWGTHKTVGTLLMALIVLRLLWALANRLERPPSLNRMALLGHMALYALMLVVPTFALLRQYGSGRELTVLGWQLMPGFDGKLEWMMTPANLLHGWLGWILLAMIVGHVAMTFYHRRSATQEDVLPRMVGKLRD